MFGLFKAKPPVDIDEFDWMMACTKWFIDEFAQEGMASAIVLPDHTYFVETDKQGHELALDLFGQVKNHCGMTDWPCDLIPGVAERETRVAVGLGLRHETESAPLGTFGYHDGRYYISYNPSELNRQTSLVATFAHELAHYLLHTAKTAPPGGRELEEHATDLAAVLLGFGVFMANSAKNFSQFQTMEEVGWEMRPQGYLTEIALVSGLAIFARLSDADTKGAEFALKAYLRKPFRKALSFIDGEYPDMASALAAIKLSDWQ